MTRVGVIIDHAILRPLTDLYSLFVPLEGGWWLFSGLVVGAMAIVMAAAASAPPALRFHR